MKKGLLVLVISLLMIPISFLGISKARAFAPIFAGCSSGLENGAWQVTGNTVTETLTIENETDLDGVAVSVIVYAGSARITAGIYAQNGNFLFAQSGTYRENEGQWVLFDYSVPVRLTPGIYKIQLSATDAEVGVFFSSNRNCYTGGEMLSNGMRYPDKDIAFAVYGDAVTQPVPDDQPAGNNQQNPIRERTSTPIAASTTATPATATNNTTDSSANNQDSQETVQEYTANNPNTVARTIPKPSPSWEPPSKEEILKMSGIKKGEPQGILGELWPILRIILIIIVVGVIALIIWRLVRRRKSQEPEKRD